MAEKGWMNGWLDGQTDNVNKQMQTINQLKKISVKIVQFREGGLLGSHFR